MTRRFTCSAIDPRTLSLSPRSILGVSPSEQRRIHGEIIPADDYRSARSRARRSWWLGVIAATVIALNALVFAQAFARASLRPAASAGPHSPASTHAPSDPSVEAGRVASRGGER